MFKYIYFFDLGNLNDFSLSNRNLRSNTYEFRIKAKNVTYDFEDLEQAKFITMAWCLMHDEQDSNESYMVIFDDHREKTPFLDPRMEKAFRKNYVFLKIAQDEEYKNLPFEKQLDPWNAYFFEMKTVSKEHANNMGILLNFNENKKTVT